MTTANNGTALWTPRLTARPHPRLRLRLSDGVRAAVQFAATDAASLELGATAAFRSYCAASRAAWVANGRQIRRWSHDERFGLWLHVWQRGQQFTDPWQPPARDLPGYGGRPVPVRISAQTLATTPRDTWTEWWLWCVHASDWSRALRGLVQRIGSAMCPPRELSDIDRAPLRGAQ